jgi:TolB protein
VWTRASAVTSRAPRLLAVVVALAAAGCGGGDSGPRGTLVDFDYVGARGIVLRPVDGGTTKLIRLVPEPIGLADYTLDGKRLVYAGDRGLYVADADGNDIRYVRGQPFNNALNYDPAWSPDDGRIVFSNNGMLYTIAADGGGLRGIGPGEFPDWSPAGDLIVFVRNWGASSSVGDVTVARSDGSGARMLGRGHWPSFSPDGESVAYSNDETIYVVPVDGGMPRVVTRDGYAPVWSPDGRYLAFARVTECGHAVCSGRIYVMPAEGGVARPVTPLIGDPSGPLDWIED